MITSNRKKSIRTNKSWTSMIKLLMISRDKSTNWRTANAVNLILIRRRMSCDFWFNRCRVKRWLYQMLGRIRILLDPVSRSKIFQDGIQLRPWLRSKRLLSRSCPKKCKTCRISRTLFRKCKKSSISAWLKINCKDCNVILKIFKTLWTNFLMSWINWWTSLAMSHPWTNSIYSNPE